MKVKQWENKNLSHFSYAILSEGEMVLIDPARDTQAYLNYANENNANIVAIIETHPHADFVSGHKELHELSGARIYTSKLLDAQYPHQSFDDTDVLEVGEVTLFALNTPGHSPDSISVVLNYRQKNHAVFTGDTLFIGDCGRPDLRGNTGKIKMSGEELAGKMYYSLRDKLALLDDDVIVYPAHGAGTLCGKSLSDAKSSTIGEEKKSNWSLQDLSENEFIGRLMVDQPFVPSYFPFDVELNRHGASPFKESINLIPYLGPIDSEKKIPSNMENVWLVDVRDQLAYKSGHLSHSMNIMEDGKFETWLGSLIKPHEKIYLVGDTKEQLKSVIERSASIGYEKQILGYWTIFAASRKSDLLDLSHFKANLHKYTIVDVRNSSERADGVIFLDSLSIPLAELRERVSEIPIDKPIVAHCAGGYRSAAASSIIEAKLGSIQQVYDLGDSVKLFQEKADAMH